MCGCNSNFVSYVGEEDHFFDDSMSENFGGKGRAKRQAKRAVRKENRQTKRADRKASGKKTLFGKIVRGAAMVVPGAMIPVKVIEKRQAKKAAQKAAQKEELEAAEPVRGLADPAPISAPAPAPMGGGSPEWENPEAEAPEQEQYEETEAPVEAEPEEGEAVEEAYEESFSGSEEKAKNKKNLLIGGVTLFLLGVLVFFLTKYLKK